MKRFVFAIISAMLLVPVSSYGWGKFGHEIVIAISQRHLSDKAKKNISKIMDYDMKIDAGWMDTHRKDKVIKHTTNYHMYNVLSDFTYDPNSTIRKGDSMTGILLADYNLSHLDNMSDSLKLLSLRMIIHFVGDFHCPVHVRIDGIKMKGDWMMNEDNWGNFHHVYDAMPSKLFKGMNADQVAALLDKGISAKKAKAFCSGTFVDWMERAARNNATIYEINPPCNEKGQHKLNPKTVELSRQNIENQLLEGGYQLAHLLNKYFGK